jgi:hypothetical protein
VVYLSRHDPHEGGLSMLTLHPIGNRPLYRQTAVRLNFAAVDELAIERGIAVPGRLARERLSHGGHDPPAAPASSS